MRRFYPRGRRASSAPRAKADIKDDGRLRLPGEAIVEGSHAGREVGGFMLTGAGAFLLLALATFDLRDYPERAFPSGGEVRNALGAAGRDAAALAYDWVGVYPSYAV